MKDQGEIDYNKHYWESFTKKVPFPSMKFEVWKLNPKNNFAYTLAIVNVHDSTQFNLYTTIETKGEFSLINKLPLNHNM